MNIGFLDRRITIEAPASSPTINAYYNILAVQEVGRKDMIHLVTERVISE